LPVKEGRPPKGAEEPVDGEEEMKWAVDAVQSQPTAPGLQLLLRLLDRGGAHHVAEGHAAEVELDVMIIRGRAVNRAPEQAHGGEV
jgi:hypothetical protein